MNRLLLFCALILTACGPGEPGPMGPQGPQGPQGPIGEQGAPGSGYVQGAVCRKSGVVVNGRSIGFTHHRYQFADGSLLTTCEVYDSLSSYTNSMLYKPGQVGTPTSTCLLVYDVDGATTGFWVFEMASSGTLSTARYSDTGSSSNGFQSTLVDCQTL